MTVTTLRTILQNMPATTQVLFSSPGISFTINKVSCEQLSDDDPIQVILEGEQV